MKKEIIFISLFFMFNISFGQDKLIPPNVKIYDSGLKAFINHLKSAIKDKDTAYVISILTPDVYVSHGGNGGVKEFRSRWNWSSGESPFWSTMDRLLQLGGTKYKGDGLYSLPYVSSNWPGDEIYGVFEHMAITGTNVNIRSNPDLINSKVVGQFSYDIVKVDYEKSVRAFEKTIWYYTESLDGKLKGFVSSDYIWSPVGYRTTFKFIDTKWKIMVLVAGD